MVVSNIIVLCASLLSGLLYRMGGMGDEDTAQPSWIPRRLRNRQMRRIGCPLVCCIVALCISPIRFDWYAHILSFVFMSVLITTYWDTFFGYDNYYAHGFFVAVAYIPYACYGLWYGFVYRIIVVTFFMGIWSKVNSNDVWEEFGRGAILPATLPLLFL